jgi:hypothetical protein
MIEEFGSSGRTRTYNPSVNSPRLKAGVVVFSMEYEGVIGPIGAPAAHNSAKIGEALKLGHIDTQQTQAASGNLVVDGTALVENGQTSRRASRYKSGSGAV